MAFNWRYNLKHIGDHFIGLVHHTADAATDSSKALFLTYDIKMLQHKRDLISGSIGARVTVLIKEETADLSKDTLLSEQIAKLNSIDNDIAGLMAEKNNIRNPFNVKKSQCECTNNCVEKG